MKDELDPNAPDDQAEDPRPLTPEARRLEFADDPGGVPLEIDGQIWTLPLALTHPGLDALREEILTRGHLRGAYPAEMLERAGGILLGGGYDLSGPEQWVLAASAKLDDLRDAVEECLLAQAERPRGYRDWVRSSLLANGLDPDLMPEADLPHVLHQLVATRRAIPAHEFLDVALAGAKRAALLSGVTIAKAPPTTPAPAPTAAPAP